MPAVVAVEEAYKFTCTDSTPDDQTGCEDPAIAGAFTDQLEGTLSALGGKYYAAAHVSNLDIAFPIMFKGDLLTVTALDRDVILARSDVQTAKIPFKNLCLRPSITSDGCNCELVAGDFSSDPRNPVLTLSPEFHAYLSSQGVPDALLPYLGIPPHRLMSSLLTDVWTLRPGAGTGMGSHSSA